MKLLKFTSIGFLIGFLVGQLTFSAFGGTSDDVTSKTYQISDFKNIYIEGSFKVVLSQGDAPSLMIESTNPEVFHQINVDDDGGSLHLSISKEWFHFKPITLYITFVDLSTIDIEGGVKLETNGYVDLDGLFVHIEGGAKVEMDLKVHHLDIEGEGGVYFDLEGVAKEFEANISGAGHIDAHELKAQVVDVKIEGVGTASVYAVEKLYANIEGVGKIKYRGTPDVHKNIEGLGVVSHD